MTDADTTDLAIFDRWCAGDKAAGSQLFERHYHAVYRFLEGKTQSDIAELVQETFLVCVRKRDNFQRKAPFLAYLYGIARFVLQEHWRRQQNRETPIDFDEISIASLSTSIGSRIVQQEDKARLLDALRELPLEQQLLLELHYWEMLDAAALAVVFEIEPATVRSRLFRAREALRVRLQQTEEHVARSLRKVRDESD